MPAAHTPPLRVGFFFLRASELQSVCKNSNHREGMASAMPKEFCHSEMESAN